MPGPDRIESGASGLAGAAREARRGRHLKVATFNINNVNRRLPNLLDWLATARPDVVCLQELKSTQAAFPEAALREA
ncbi:MAG: endonuclease/exonuclease/phosphatase family protein, partial [Acetobacteraceae bacterium]